MRRLNDQALILEAIGQVRAELRAAAAAGTNTIETTQILIRLATLYALLDVHGLLAAVEKADTREKHEVERKVA